MIIVLSVKKLNKRGDILCIKMWFLPARKIQDQGARIKVESITRERALKVVVKGASTYNQ